MKKMQFWEEEGKHNQYILVKRFWNVWGIILKIWLSTLKHFPFTNNSVYIRHPDVCMYHGSQILICWGGWIQFAGRDIYDTRWGNHTK